MIQCPICQVMNEETASFCAECGQRFGVSEAPRQEIPRQTAPERAPEPPAGQGQAKKKKVKLHSPIFGDAIDDEDEIDNLRSTGPRSPRSPNAGEKKPGKRGLRSPLLGADDADDDFEPSPRTGRSDSPGKAKKSRLRSPLLGEEDFDEPPHPGHQGPQSHKSHLRSPLLGGDDFDDYEEPPQSRSRQSDPRSGGRQRLRSPVLGGDDFDDYDDDEELDEDNPNVLRSPLLQAKRPKHDLPSHQTPPQPPHQTPEPPLAPFKQPQVTAPPQPAPQYQMPPQPANPSFPGPEMPGGFPQPQAQPQPGFPPQAQTPQQAAYINQYQSPKESQSMLAADPGIQQVRQPAPAPAQPPAPAPAPAPAPVQPQIANNPLTSAPPPKAPEAPKTAPQRREEEKPEVGPQDRRGNDRRRSRERRSFSNLVDDRDSDDLGDYQGQHAGPPAGGMMAIMVTAFIGALFKVWYLVTLFTQYDFKSAQMLIFDQVATLVVFVGLIIFASSAKKN